MKFSAPRLLLQLEGAGVLAGSAFCYHRIGASWSLFALLFLAPDVFMVGYLAGSKVGAVLYNFAHTYLSPLVLLLAGLCLPISMLQAVALIWIAHIGFDRLLGYGLKYSTEFKDTHFGRV